MRTCLRPSIAFLAALSLHTIVAAQTLPTSTTPVPPSNSAVPTHTFAEIIHTEGGLSHDERERRLKAEREAWYKTPQGKRELEREAMIKKADGLLKKNQLVPAQALYNTILAQTSTGCISDQARRGLGEIARRTGDTSTALRYYRECIFDEPNQTWTIGLLYNPEVRMKYALILRDAGLYDEAWESYQVAMKYSADYHLPQVMRNDVPTGQFIVTASLSLSKMLDGFDQSQAIAFAQDAVRANPTNGLPHFYLGKLLLATDPVEAQKEYEKAVRYGHGDYVKEAGIDLNDWKRRGLPKPIPPVPALETESATR